MTKAEVMDGCPLELEYVFEAQKLRKKMQDESNWELGIYIESAVTTAVEHNLAGRKARSEYISEPLSHSIDKEKRDINKARKQFVASLETMAANWRLEHGKDTEGKDNG